MIIGRRAEKQLQRAIEEDRSGPWYRKAWRRIRDAAFVLSGKASALRLED